MEFQNNMALLYDSFILNQFRSRIYSVLSFTGNVAYINALANDLIDNLGLTEIEYSNIQLCLDDAQKSVRLFALLEKLAESRDKVGIISYFVDKCYGMYLFQMGLLFPEINKADEDITQFIEYVYGQYSKKIIRLDSDIDLKERFGILNRYVKGLVYTQPEYEHYRSFYTDNSVRMANLMDALEIMYADKIPENLLSEFMFYSKDIINKYQSVGVNVIRSTKNAGERLRSVAHLMSDYDSVSISFISEDDQKNGVRKLVTLLLNLVEYNMNKIVEIRNVEELTENDKQLFVFIWTLFQGKKNEWLFSKDTFQKISNLFESVKKELNI